MRRGECRRGEVKGKEGRGGEEKAALPQVGKLRKQKKGRSDLRGSREVPRSRPHL